MQFSISQFVCFKISILNYIKKSNLLLLLNKINYKISQKPINSLLTKLFSISCIRISFFKMLLNRKFLYFIGRICTSIIFTTLKKNSSVYINFNTGLGIWMIHCSWSIQILIYLVCFLYLNQLSHFFSSLSKLEMITLLLFLMSEISKHKDHFSTTIYRNTFSVSLIIFLSKKIAAFYTHVYRAHFYLLRSC